MQSEERAAQEEYWKQHSDGATVEDMMLDSQAREIDRLDRPEVLAYLGPIGGKRVVELGAGIGRFTGELAASATRVTAYDFMEPLVAKNREQHGHLANLEFVVEDVTATERPAQSTDVVFSNWLLMYLSDREVEILASKMLIWLSVGGICFFRESCFQQSGDRRRKQNPSHYRNPRDYFRLFDAAHVDMPDGKQMRFELVGCRCIESYVAVKKNQNQICWKWKKVVKNPQDNGEFRHFLDNYQYAVNGILRYERMFGEGFISTGGLHTTKDILKRLRLQPGERVLDIGCGIGGGDFYMCQEYGVHVHCIDLSVNMFMIATERAQRVRCSASFEVADITKREFEDESYDVLYSRDTILHIHNKPELFCKLLKMLKPGGRLLITDYCRSSDSPSERFAEYIQQRNYDLHSVEAYGKMLSDAGFVDVVAEDATGLFISSVQRELGVAERERNDFVAEFSEQDFEAVVSGWKEKLDRATAGEQCWGLFMARRATN
ncbi:unnamed protein product [Ostreobium quekettii]|uniref:phosphoethanolamine N-methyltransferase n=1 Tax=Ostreobium quekettii TaxID=121088 RepID=A0A8S1IT12_9CHLO|nr:unnamed protein product [Ostreobium quekettii]|eukprot:evm.model.scf_129.6 EVM.evm.TU.scf_129.6   scf_129:56433-61582(-)